MSPPSADSRNRNQQGLALVMAMMLLALLMTMLLGYFANPPAVALRKQFHIIAQMVTGNPVNEYIRPAV